MLEGYMKKDMKKSKKEEVYEKDGFWTFDGANQGYNTKENAEKVVNPPRNPAIRSKLAFSNPFSERRPYAKPIASEPIIFTVKVP